MNNPIKSIVLILLGLVAGIGIGVGIAGTNLFRHARNSSTPYGVKPESPVTIQATSEITEKYYRDKLDSLATVNDQLRKEISTTKSAIRLQRYNNDVLNQLVDTLISHTNAATDTAIKLQDCDSLTAAVTDMMIVTAQKDSLYDSLVTSLQAQVMVKDEGLQLQQQAYNALKLFFEQSIAQQDVLHSRNLLLERQNHRQVIRSRVLSTGIVLLTGIVTYNIIRH